MSDFIILDKNEIESAFCGERRKYFAGNLKKPQNLPFIRSENVEMGLTSYDTFTAEPPHRHSVATEYQYMVAGRTQYMDTETGKVYEFKAGDFYAVRSGTTYAQKSEPGTKIIFVKEPSINDKEQVTMDENVKRWLADETMQTI